MRPYGLGTPKSCLARPSPSFPRRSLRTPQPVVPTPESPNAPTRRSHAGFSEHPNPSFPRRSLRIPQPVVPTAESPNAPTRRSREGGNLDRLELRFLPTQELRVSPSTINPKRLTNYSCGINGITSRENCSMASLWPSTLSAGKPRMKF